MSDHATLGVFLLLTLVFPLGAMLAAWLFRPKPRPSEEKLLPYECGVDTKGPTWIRFRVNYFLYALVFLAFDIETIFLFPLGGKVPAVGLIRLCRDDYLHSHFIDRPVVRLEGRCLEMVLNEADNRDDSADVELLEKHNIIVTTLEKIWNWSRARSFGLYPTAATAAR